MNKHHFHFAPLLAASLGLVAPALHGADTATNAWSSTLIAPVANPIFFESPAINSELRPIFMYHQVNDSFLGTPTDVQVYALQFRLKLTDRLALIATKDGFVKINPDGASSVDGWADIAAGLKYALIADEENRFILTPGVKFELPTGDDEVFQGNGDGAFDVFVSTAKGINDLQLMANLGVFLPLDAGEESTQLHYSLQVAYPVCKWFKPFASLNGYTGLTDGDTPGFGALDSEGYDLINFGSGSVAGETMIILGAGFRVSPCDSFDVGFAYEQGVDHSNGLFDKRCTVDVIWKF